MSESNLIGSVVAVGVSAVSIILFASFLGFGFSLGQEGYQNTRQYIGNQTGLTMNARTRFVRKL
jgi:hypothetical protein